MSEDAEKKPPLKNRLKDLMEEYGTLAITIYFSIFFATLGGFTIAIKSGFEVDGGAENTGTLVVACLVRWCCRSVSDKTMLSAT